MFVNRIVNRTCTCTCTLLCLAALLFTSTAQADPLPTKDSSSAFASGYGFGYAGGNLYIYTGDSTYRADTTNPNNVTYTSVAAGVESAFSPSRGYQGSFATNDNDQAIASFGYDGGVVVIDLTGVVSPASITGLENTNLYSVALRNDNTAYGFEYDNNTFDMAIRHFNTSGSLNSFASPGSDPATGGLTFDPAGNLYVSTFDYNTYPYPDPRGTAHFYRYDAADLAAWESGGGDPTPTLVGTGITNGNGTIAFGLDGNLYFNTTTGIGQVNLATGDVSTLYGDLLDTDLYTYVNLPLNGLAINPATGELAFAEYNTGAGQYELRFLAVPEPATTLLLFAGVAGLTLHRRKHG